MPQPNFNEVHVNRPLTNISVAFLQRPDVFLAPSIFPIVSVSNASNTYRTYDRGFWFRADAQRRAPGTESAGGGYGIGTDSYACLRDAIHKDVDDPTMANADEPLQLETEAVQYCTSQIALKQEVRLMSAVFTTGVWTTNPTITTTWDDSASDPVNDIKTNIRTVVGLVGGSYRPNTLVLGLKCFDNLCEHPDILDRIKYAAGMGNPATANEQTLAQVLGLERVMVSRAVQNTAAEGAANAISLIAATRSALMLYVAPSPGLYTPSAGYTFSWNGTGNGFGIAVKRFRMEPIESDRIEAEAWYTQKVVAPDLGVFFNNAVAA